TKKCSYNNLWNQYPIARFCRGLVWNSKTNYIAALPLPKFMNLGESSCDVSPTELMQAERIRFDQKVDGSLSIIFYDNDEWHVMTRGSFISEQCQTAQKWIIQNNTLKKDNTYLAEIIYPANRIVVDYGKYTGFIFFGCYNIYDGAWFDVNTSLIKNCLTQEEWIDIERKYSSFDGLKSIVANLSGNEEGFVIMMEDGRRCKLKGDKYCELHKAKFGLSPLSVWENMVNCSVEASLVLLPEEFKETYNGYLKILTEKKDALYKEYMEKYDSLPVTGSPFADEKTNRKNFAMEVMKLDKRYQGFCFAMYKRDFEGVNDMMMDLIRPDGNVLD
ncbi:MAG: RNA ligase, partial [bacterium]